MTFLRSKILRSIILSTFVIWSVVSFWFLNQILFVNVIMLALGAIALFAIYKEILTLYVITFLSFACSFALYGFLFSFNLPLWVIMIAILVIFGYLFTYLEKKSNILKQNKFIFLFIFSLIVLEVFLFLSYFLVSPINRSLIIAIIVYTISGFTFWVLRSDNVKSFSTYVYLSVIAIVAILISARWG